MIHYLDGDLFKSNCTFILHQCNCQKNMGAGFAASVKKFYPEAFFADQNFSYNKKNRLGKYSYGVATNEQRIIINLYGQEYYGNSKKTGITYTKMDKLTSSLEEFLTDMNNKINEKEFPIKIGLPYLMGCDLAGGDWNELISILERLSIKYNRDFYIYKLNK